MGSGGTSSSRLEPPDIFLAPEREERLVLRLRLLAWSRCRAAASTKKLEDSIGICAVMKLFILLFCLLAFAPPLFAATLVVTNTDDAGPGSLRQAMLDANVTLA